MSTMNKQSIVSALNTTMKEVDYLSAEVHSLKTQVAKLIATLPTNVTFGTNTITFANGVGLDFTSGAGGATEIHVIKNGTILTPILYSTA
jgi:hypothetical protein